MNVSKKRDLSKIVKESLHNLNIHLKKLSILWGRRKVFRIMAIIFVGLCGKKWKKLYTKKTMLDIFINGLMNFELLRLSANFKNYHIKILKQKILKIIKPLKNCHIFTLTLTNFKNAVTGKKSIPITHKIPLMNILNHYLIL